MKILNLILVRVNTIRFTIIVLIAQKKNFNEVSIRLNANLKTHMILKTKPV